MPKTLPYLSHPFSSQDIVVGLPNSPSIFLQTTSLPQGLTKTDQGPLNFTTLLKLQSASRNPATSFATFLASDLTSLASASFSGNCDHHVEEEG